MFEHYDLRATDHALSGYQLATYPRFHDWRNSTNLLKTKKAESLHSGVSVIGNEGIRLIAQASDKIRQARESKSGFDAVSVATDLEQGMLYVYAVGEHYLETITSPYVNPEQKLACFKKFNDIMNAQYNGMRKFDELYGTDSSSILKRFESFRREFTQSLCRELSEIDQLPEKKWYQSNSPRPKQGRPPEYFERVIYNLIEDVNISERNASEDELGNHTVFNSKKHDSLQDYESNCAHCAPVTMATLYGANLRAGSRETEYSDRISTKQALPPIYNSKWQPVTNLDHLFDTIESEAWPNNTFAFIHWGYTTASYAHITIAGKINGRACIIEGQSQSVTTRDATGEFREVAKDKAKNKSSLGYLEPNKLKNIQYLHVMPANKETEIDRVQRAWDSMYPNRNVNRGPTARNM